MKRERQKLKLKLTLDHLVQNTKLSLIWEFQ